MADALDMLANLQALDIHSLAIDTATEAEPVMVDAMAEQLSIGKRSDGSNISPPYAPFTIREKEKKSGLSAVTENVTLFDIGAHYAALFADVQGDIIEYGSKNSKSQSLQDRYGKIYGLNEEARAEVIEDFIEPRFQSKVERETGLKID